MVVERIEWEREENSLICLKECLLIDVSHSGIMHHVIGSPIAVFERIDKGRSRSDLQRFTQRSCIYYNQVQAMYHQVITVVWRGEKEIPSQRRYK